ncbi:uncharacterized protein zgc:66455 isoform X2 [Esox lucius]|uniref:CUB domain-containing protein n=1 Tax=Esox lucius TaxID=8010 RepID=A0A3P8Y8Z4_ESOLU|nr:uncharacterized protein zgc:66455 isoform X2 [Esox lucius]
MSKYLKLCIPRVFLICYSLFMANCDLPWTNENYAYRPADDHHVSGGNAFLALRSCHQVLRGESGEFFSPDYMCSNPPLWCNWTIQVDPGKRVYLHLEDFTPADACPGKLDQIHLDEPMGVAGGHSILEKCWSQASYVSLSSTLHVVLLIGGNPSPAHRGFYGRYKALEPPVTYYANAGATEEPMMTKPTIRKPKPLPVPIGFARFSPTNGGGSREAISFQLPTPPAQAKPEVLFVDFFHQIPPSVANELPSEEPVVEEGTSTFSPVQGEDWNRGISDETEEIESKTDGQSTEDDWNVMNLGGDLVSRNSDVLSTPSSPGVVTHRGTSRSVRKTTLNRTEQTQSLNPRPLSPNTSTMRRNVDAQSQGTTGTAKQHVPPTVSNMFYTKDMNDRDGVAGNQEWQNITADASTATSYTPSPIEARDPFDHFPNMVEPFSKRRYEKVRNHSEVPHLPGVNLTTEEDWNHIAKTLLISVKSLMNQQFKMVYTDVLSCKRIKRLNAGVLYIFWLHTGDGPTRTTAHWNPHQVLKELLNREVSPSNSSARSVVISVSAVDVNECSTQLTLCDVNADCVNRFGSYECHCHPGYRDMSPLGSGGTLCVNTTGTGHYSYSSAQMGDLIIGIYVVCFLVSFLILLLCAAGVLYLRRHQGAFAISCWRSGLPPIPPPDYKRNNGGNGDGSISTHPELPPPPPPPIRRPKEGWVHPQDCCPSVDLPLLRFSPLRPLDGHNKPEGGKL